MKPFPFLIAALALTLNAQDAKPDADQKPTLEVGKATAAAAAATAEAPKADQKFFAQVWTATSPQEFVNFQQRIRILSQQVEEFKRSQLFLENALTTPEREARSHEIAAKQAKLQADNEAMGKLYGGFSILRPYQLVPTKILFLTPLSNDEFTKVSAAKDFKPESVLSVEDKKFLVRDTIAGAVEVETFSVLLKQIAETKTQLQQLVDLQPKLKTDEDKKKAEEAVKATQERVNKLSEEFKKSRNFDYPSENGTIPAEAKLFVQITEAEKAQLEKANPPKTEEKAK
jgi:hypothetical protein